MRKYIKPATQVLATEVEAFLNGNDLGYSNGTGGKVSGQYTKDSEWDDDLDSDW